MAQDQRTTELAALASIPADPADLLLYVADLSEVDPDDQSKKMALALLDARYPGAVSSVFGRTGAVVAASGDYSAGQISGLGSAALQSVAAFATAAQGSLADTALQAAAIGATVQGYDADLATIAGLAKADGNFIVGDGAAWTVESGATARASLGLGTIATLNSPLPIINGGSGQVTQQAAIDALTNVAAATNEHVLTKDTASGNVIFKAAAGGGAPVGATYIVQTPDGTLTNEQALSVLATGLLKNTTTTGVLSIAAQGTDYYAPGGTDVAIADGGTGQSTAQLAINALTAVAGATNEHVLTKDTATGNAIFKATGSGSSPPFADTQAIVMGSADNTKLLRFEIDGFSAGATRVMTVPNLTSTIAVRDTNNAWLAAQTFFDAVNVSGSVTISSTDASQKFAVQHSGGSPVFLVDTVARNASFFTEVAGTNAVSNSLGVFHSSSGGGTADGFGAALRVVLESSVNGNNQEAGRLRWLWATATDASRKARSIWSVDDTAEREGIRIEASGTAPMLGVLGAAAIARQAHIADPGGGGTQDAEARTAINSILLALENFGFLATS